MGKMEEQNAKAIRRTKVTRAVIGVVALAGIITVAAIAPKLVGALGRSKYMRQRLYQSRSNISKLIREGYLELERNDGKTYVRLTEKGERFATLMHEGKLAPKKPRHWDGKWRLLIFDVPEKRRGTREKIRTALITLGFVRLQDSVWAYPYDREDFITILKADFRMGKDVLYIIADHIEYDAPLRTHFNLPKRT